MRIWSIHPKYLDSKGLVALWRETLLAKNVLEGNTKGYRNHPQLIRFKALKQPLNAVNYYLKEVWTEADKRDYHFDKSKFVEVDCCEHIDITSGQMDYEVKHLLKKLKVRDEKRYNDLVGVSKFDIHPLFNLIEGGVEPWENI